MAVLAAYLDECVDPRLASQLSQRGFRVTTALSEGTLGLSDERQIAFAFEHCLLLVSHDQHDFRRLHADYQQQGRPHSGILLLPFGPLIQVDIRIAMLLDWVALQAEPRTQLFRWHDSQGWLVRGNQLADYGPAELALALGRSTS